MKKTFLTFALLLAVTALNAQTLIKVALQKGDKATYENVTSINAASPMGGGSQNVKITNKTCIEVKDAAADGYKGHEGGRKQRRGNADGGQNQSVYQRSAGPLPG